LFVGHIRTRFGPRSTRGVARQNVTPILVAVALVAGAIVPIGVLQLPAAATSGGNAIAFGGNEFGALGIGSEADVVGTPSDLLVLSDHVVAIDGNASGGIALKDDGTVWTWGRLVQVSNGPGQSFSDIPIQVPSLSDVVAISAGPDYDLALTADGTVWSWGADDFGQLGDGGVSQPRLSPGVVNGLGTGVIAISAGDSHAVALKSDGSVVGWGDGVLGQLGVVDVNVAGHAAPTPIIGLDSHVVAVSAGNTQTLALMDDGTVRALGYNHCGELGNGTTTQSATPLQVSGLTGVKQIEAGGGTSYALKSDGSVWGWGCNANGEIGDGTNIERDVPVPVSGLSRGVTLIGAGDNHAVAAKSDGSAVLWGFAFAGGGADDYPHYSPVVIPHVSGVRAIGAGDDYNTFLVVVPVPTIALSTPADGGSYTVGQHVVASYSCFDANLVSCIGDKPNGASIDTSTPGHYSFTVTATDGGNNTTTVVHNYVVHGPPPTIALRSPVNGATYSIGDTVSADYSCADGTGLPLPVTCNGYGDGGYVGSGGTVPLSLGTNVFTVEAIDTTGQETDVISTYTVEDAATATLPPEGGTVATANPPTVSDPVQTSVTAPSGGDVSIVETAATTAAPSGYNLGSIQANITAPPADASTPLNLQFSLDPTLLNALGASTSTVVVFRDGTPIAPCDDPDTAVAAPDPCVYSRATGTDGTTHIGVYTSHASQWNFGALIPLTLNTTTLAAGRVPVPYHTTLSASFGTLPYTWAVTSGALPSGVTLDATTGTISGAPHNAGTFTFTAQVTDAVGATAQRTLHLTINASTPQVGFPYLTNIPAFNGVAPYVWAVTSGRLPPGLVLDPETGTITGTPTTEGRYRFKVTVTDSKTKSPKKVRIATTIAVAPSLMSLSPTGIPAASKNVKYTTTLTASGGIAPYKFKLTSGALPAGIKLSANGRLAGKPTSAGASTFTVTVTDKFKYTQTRTYSLTVT
jgi:alpha-tubulin suppressor-like RCC1 family protein